MRVYISLPITGLDEAAQRERADLMMARLSRMGHEPVNPFHIHAGKGPGYFDHICRDLRALADCDAIMLCKGWHESRGCRVECGFAKIYGKRVMFESVEFPKEMRSWES